MKLETPSQEKGILPWLEWGRSELAFLGPHEAREECEEILEALLGVSRAELYLARDLNSHLLGPFYGLIQGRKARLPLAYLLRRAPFWEEEYEVGAGVFIPRPETETMIEAFLKRGGFLKSERFWFLDLGTGSGNIAVTVAQLFPNSKGVATDLSGEALAFARRNVASQGVRGRVAVIQADGLLAFGKGAFDVIFSNPPYVASPDWAELDPEVLREPPLALEGGPEGLDFYRRIFQELSCLKGGGGLWLEIGWGERCAVESLFRKDSFRFIEVFRDLNQIERVMGGIGFNG